MHRNRALGHSLNIMALQTPWFPTAADLPDSNESYYKTVTAGNDTNRSILYAFKAAEEVKQNEISNQFKAQEMDLMYEKWFSDEAVEGRRTELDLRKMQTEEIRYELDSYKNFQNSTPQGNMFLTPGATPTVDYSTTPSSSIKEQFKELPTAPSGEGAIKLTVYGSPDDPLLDTNTSKNLGNRNNQLNDQSVALSRDLIEKYGGKGGEQVWVTTPSGQRQYIGNYDDTTAKAFEGRQILNTIDIYDKSGSLGSDRRFLDGEISLVNPSGKKESSSPGPASSNMPVGGVAYSPYTPGNQEQSTQAPSASAVAEPKTADEPYSYITQVQDKAAKMDGFKDRFSELEQQKFKIETEASQRMREALSQPPKVKVAMSQRIINDRNEALGVIADQQNRLGGEAYSQLPVKDKQIVDIMRQDGMAPTRAMGFIQQSDKVRLAAASIYNSLGGGKELGERMFGKPIMKDGYPVRNKDGSYALTGGIYATNRYGLLEVANTVEVDAIAKEAQEKAGEKAATPADLLKDVRSEITSERTSANMWEGQIKDIKTEYSNSTADGTAKTPKVGILEEDPRYIEAKARRDEKLARINVLSNMEKRYEPKLPEEYKTPISKSPTMTAAEEINKNLESANFAPQRREQAEEAFNAFVSKRKMPVSDYATSTDMYKDLASKEPGSYAVKVDGVPRIKQWYGVEKFKESVSQIKKPEADLVKDQRTLQSKMDEVQSNLEALKKRSTRRRSAQDMAKDKLTTEAYIKKFQQFAAQKAPIDDAITKISVSKLL